MSVLIRDSLNTRPGETPETRPKQTPVLSAAVLALILAAIMVLTIAGTVFVSNNLAFVSIVPLALAILFFASRDSVAATAALFVFLAMEGMYKYLSLFAPAVYAIRPALILVIVLGWLLSLRARNAKLTAAPLTALIVGFLLWGATEILNDHGFGLVRGLATFVLFYLSPVAFYVLGVNTVKSSRQVEIFCYVLVAVCTVVSAFAVVQFVMGLDWTKAHMPGYASALTTDWFVLNEQGAVTASSFRPASTTPIGGGGAVWANLGVITSFGLLFSPKLGPGRKAGLITCLMLNIVGLFVSGVRLYMVTGIFEAVFFVLIAAGSTRNMERTLGMLLGVGAVVAVASAGAMAISGGSLMQRYADTLSNPLAKYSHDRGGNLVALTNLATRYPLGVGYQYGLGHSDTDIGNSADPAVQARNGETQWGAIAGDMGVPGLVLLAGLMLGCLVNGWRAFRRLRRPHTKILAATLLASLAGYFPACFGGPAMQGTIHFWYIAAILIVLPAVEKREAAAQGPEKPAGSTAPQIARPAARE